MNARAPSYKGFIPASDRASAAARGASRKMDTKPEVRLKRELWGAGIRYRRSNLNLPGKPDIVLPRWGTAIFVHGCFWHGHDCARGARTPKANREYWIGKISRNVARDERVRNELLELGWGVLVIWECELGKVDALEHKFTEAFPQIAKCAPSRRERTPR